MESWRVVAEVVRLRDCCYACVTLGKVGSLVYIITGDAGEIMRQPLARLEIPKPGWMALGSTILPSCEHP